MFIKNARQRFVGAAGYERLLLLGSVGFAVLAVSGAYFLIRKTGDPHWMNRAGAAIVATEALIAIAEFLRRERLDKVRHTTSMSRGRGTGGEELEFDASRVLHILEDEIRRAELHVLVIAMLLAMIGEVLHGFGDLLLEAFIG
jgi:hypothetical protein